MFLYAVFYFFTKLEIEQFVSGLLYFGYTSCPDVCPVDLAKIVKIADAVRQASG